MQTAADLTKDDQFRLVQAAIYCIEKELAEKSRRSQKQAKNHQLIGTADPFDITATVLTETSRIDSSIESLRKRRYMCEEALQKIDLGTFGICEDPSCGEEIPFDDLRKRPWTTLCKTCKDNKDIRNTLTVHGGGKIRTDKSYPVPLHRTY